MKLIKEIKTKNISIYSFYQDLSKTFFELGDLHINLNLTKYLELFTATTFSQPLKLYIKMYNDTPRIFGDVFHSEEYHHYFKNYTTVYSVIRNNKDIPIYEINGMNPFDYINNFGGIYNNLKSPYATFTFKYNNHNNVTFYSYPLSIDDLTNFTVVYDSNDTFTTDFIVICPHNLSNTNISNINDKSKFGNEKVNINASINVEKFKIHDFNFISENSIIKDNKIKSNNPSLNIINWNYSYYNIFKCRVDEENKVNVYFISGFGSQSDLNRYSQVIIKCANLFDTNKYPIILINSFNPGGQSFLAQILLEILSPKITTNIYGSFRKTEHFKKSREMDQYLTYFSNSENCQTLQYEHLMREEHIISYGDNLTDILTDPFILLGKEVKKQLNDVKKNFKNPRNSTDILVFTDGFSYSAASIFCKYLQYYGGAITAGYFYNPTLKNISFDSSLSPTILYDFDILQILSPEGYKPLYDNYKFKMHLPGIQTFYNPNNLSIPLEYEITPVDEITNIFDIYSDENYTIFINESLKIFEKYKTKCNPKNKKLILYTSECDGSFNNSYTHGGYECGDNGTWTTNCVPSYCDIGYIFDHNKNECIIDVCSYDDGNIVSFVLY